MSNTGNLSNNQFLIQDQAEEPQIIQKQAEGDF